MSCGITAVAVSSVSVCGAADGDEAMTAPAVVIAIVIPGADAEKDAVVEVVWSVVTLMDAGVGGVVVVAVGAGGWRSADADDNLCVGVWYRGPEEEDCDAAEQSFQDAH
jgi:hypothetical protein